jgi:hypothetical protein
MKTYYQSIKDKQSQWLYALKSFEAFVQNFCWKIRKRYKFFNKMWIHDRFHSASNIFKFLRLSREGCSDKVFLLIVKPRCKMRGGKFFSHLFSSSTRVKYFVEVPWYQWDTSQANCTLYFSRVWRNEGPYLVLECWRAIKWDDSRNMFPISLLLHSLQKHYPDSNRWQQINWSNKGIAIATLDCKSTKLHVLFDD